MPPLRRTLPLLAALALASTLAGCGIGVPRPDGSRDPSARREGSAGITNGPCSGRSFEVADDGAQLVLDGDCGDVVVSADDASINLDGATSVRLTGKGSTVIANGPVGDVVVDGERNGLNGHEIDTVEVAGNQGTVIATKIGTLTATGDENTVNWDSGATAATSDTGRDNVFVH